MVTELAVDAGRAFGVGREEAAEVVEGVRRGLVGAFEQAVDGLREDVRRSSGIVDDVVAGVRALPLVHG
jgi:serine/threonine-protein kinase HipA